MDKDLINDYLIQECKLDVEITNVEFRNGVILVDYNYEDFMRKEGYEIDLLLLLSFIYNKK